MGHGRWPHTLTEVQYALKKPDALKFTKPHTIRPFEDAGSLEFLGQKNDAAHVILGTNQKKRPHTLTWARLFAGEVMDMLELSIEGYKASAEFGTGNKVPVGMRPLLLFQGQIFDTHAEYVHVKSLVMDFFAPASAGAAPQQVDQSGLQHVVVVSAEEPATSLLAASGSVQPVVYVRVYRAIMRRSDELLPRMELEEMGPRLDLRLGRRQAAEPEVWKRATARAHKPTAENKKKRKNIEMDLMGDKLGRIHVGRQELGKLQTRKFRGLKRERAEE